MCGSSWPISYRHSSFWHDFSHHKNIPPYGHKRSPPISGCSRWNTPEDYVCAPQLWMNPNVRSLRENWDQGLSFLCPELSCLTPLGPSFLIHKMTFPSKAKGLQLSPVYLHSGFSLKWSTELWMTNTKTTNWIRSLWGRNSTSKNSTVQPCVENPWPWLLVSVKKTVSLVIILLGATSMLLYMSTHTPLGLFTPSASVGWGKWHQRKRIRPGNGVAHTLE